jgi:ABC-2 type transport system permease protein
MFGPSLYPSSTFVGLSRVVFTLIFPSLVIGGIPVNILLTLNPSEMLLFLLIAIFWLFFSIFLFNAGLKKYESGNMIGNR